MYGRKVRYKNNERIINEIKYLNSNFGFDTFWIVDDLFPPPKPILLDLVKKIKSLNFSFKFMIQQGTAVALLDEEIIDALISLGLKSFTLPIETGCEYTMKNIINKNISFDHAKRIIKILRDKKVGIEAHFIFGFPRETKELMQETINFIKSIDIDWVYIFRALPLPGSRMLKELEDKGILDSNKMDWDTLRYGIREYDTPEISAKDLEELVYDTNIICNFFNNSNLKNKRYEKANQDFTRIIEKYPFHIPARYCKSETLEKMGQISESELELDKCIEWISKDKESKRLYERYKEYMPKLKN
jgi:MoaA/NifB/PqqE/SkfB family radical SAM enzyme